MTASPTPSADEALPIRHSGSLLRTIAEAIPASIAYYEARSMACRFANERYAQSCGHTAQSILGLTAREAMGEAVWAEIVPQVERCLTGERVRYMRQHRMPDASELRVEVNLIPHQVRGQLLGVFVLILDITHHWLAERAVRESQERMQKFSAATQEAIIFHHQGRVTDGNEALERLIGYRLDELVGTRIFDYIRPEDRQKAIEYTLRGEEHSYEVEAVHRDGRHIPIEVVGKTMPFDGKTYRIVVVRDISAHRQAQERAAFMALHDGLTQLPNRRYLLEQMRVSLERPSHPVAGAALLYINIDHFKTLNEGLGPQGGDALLCALGEQLRARLCPGDFLAHCGGDSFALLRLGVTCAAQALQEADALRQSLEAVDGVGPGPIELSCSIGVALYPAQARQGDDLLRCAERALQQTKLAGRAHCQLYQAPTDAHAPPQALQWEQELRQALREGGLVLHYQPQIRLSDGALLGFEALVRWQHPLRGLVGPQAFIGFAESRGLIAPIGRWVLREACRQMCVWQAMGLGPWGVAVNVSALELRQRDLAAEVGQVLEDTGLPAHCLEIELTESVFLLEAETVRNTLQALRDRGVRISIDDFGTGYSSLAYLKHHPLDVLKIDRSFVADLPDKSAGVALVRAIIEMGHSLQLGVIAEGVETPAQQALLQQLGCDMAQGYAIARPLGAALVPAWAHSRQR